MANRIGIIAEIGLNSTIVNTLMKNDSIIVFIIFSDSVMFWKNIFIKKEGAKNTFLRTKCLVTR